MRVLGQILHQIDRDFILVKRIKTRVDFLIFYRNFNFTYGKSLVESLKFNIIL